MRVGVVWMPVLIAALAAIAEAQTRRAPARQAPTRPPAAAALTRLQAQIDCPSELGVGVKTGRRFCDVLTGREPEGGVIVNIPPHRGPVSLSFELHNRHTYSEELVKTKKAFRDYTATIGVLTMDNTLVERAVIQSQFRTMSDLFDRLSGGAGAGGLKAVAPTGSEFISVELPADVGEQVSLLGERLRVIRADGGVDTFIAPGRPIAAVSNVMVEFRPGPAPRKPTPKKP
jgi:hypothetical protein